MTVILPPTFDAPAAPEARFGAPAPAALTGGVVAIGNFDGVHRGHAHVIAQARAIAGRIGAPTLALTFEPHPRALFQPGETLFRLTDPHAKARLLTAAGVDGVAVADFDRAFANLSADEFVDRVLVEWLRARHVVTGADFRFGARRAGDVARLTVDGLKRGFGVTAASALTDGGVPVSSSAIREALRRAEIGRANALLGRAYAVSGLVLHGEKRGRGLGYPTANMRLDAGNGLAHGVYAVKFAVDGVWRDGVASFGRRPTFDNGAPLLETFVFDFSGDLYGKVADVAFAGFIRAELKFDGIDALIAQMDRDSAEARRILAG